MNEQLKPFQQVLVRQHSKQEWRADIYSHKNITTSGGEYHEIIPYDGNDALLGTTDSPQPKRWRAGKDEKYWYINPMLQVDNCYDTGYDGDDECYSIGNYFFTKEEAQAMADKIKAILKGEQL